MTVLTTIRTTLIGELGNVAGLLAEAFGNDPVTRWLVPDPEAHRQVMGRLFLLAAADAVRAGVVDVLTDDRNEPIAAALWFDLTRPGRPEDGDQGQPGGAGGDVGSGWAAAFHGHPEAAARWHELDAAMTRNHLAGPHCHLFAIGVHPTMIGRGLGSSLLTYRNARLEEAGQVAYLEATSMASRRLYERHGYVTLSCLDVPGSPTLHRMWRPVGAVSSPTRQAPASEHVS